MAKQVGLIKFEGTIGDLSFYKDKRGHQARMKTGPSKEQINSDPRFLRTKENSQEFGRAILAGKKLRRQLREVLEQGSDRGFSNRLTSRMLKVLHADEINLRGERQVLSSNLKMLQGMDCNIKSRFDDVFLLAVNPSYDRESGEALFDIPAFMARSKIARLDGATHVQVQLVLAEYDSVDPDIDGVVIGRSAYIDILSSEESLGELIELSLVASEGSAVFVLMGLSYFQEVNNAYYPLANGQYNALSIVEVNST